MCRGSPDGCGPLRGSAMWQVSGAVWTWDRCSPAGGFRPLSTSKSRVVVPGGPRSNFISFGQRPIGPGAGGRERISDVSFGGAGVAEGHNGHGCKAGLSTGAAGGGEAALSRWDVMRNGAKLALVDE